MRNCTKLIRSKNAGPFVLTIDVMFENSDMFYKCIEQNILSVQNIAKIYGIEAENIDIFEIPMISTIKISFPRAVSQGDLGDSDNHGGQQYAPILDLEIIDGS
ncbi:DUF4387 domain-containing protein [Candidatus Puniceispirillum sp.]|nr:DUF4387 domain-containing protein [Candidatus Puniceispirillum sp.]